MAAFQSSGGTGDEVTTDRIGAEGAERLAGVLVRCSSLAVLDLGYNNIGTAGAERLAGVLGQCSLLAELDLEWNGIDSDGIAMLRACWPGDSGLRIGWQQGPDGIRTRTCE